MKAESYLPLHCL